MIITRTPFRISFVGGGSDIPNFYRDYGGAVLSTTIDKYMYISSHKYWDESKIHTKYSESEIVNSVSDLKHPILKTIMHKLRIPTGLEISSIADVPAGTGMGSSSSFTVGTLHNLMAQLGRDSEIDKAFLGKAACQIELEDLKEPIGKQDQYAAAYGGLNIIRFLPNEDVVVEPIVLAEKLHAEFNHHMKIYYFGNQRSASSILSEQSQNSSKKDKIQALKTMVSFVDPFSEALMNGDWKLSGEYLHENWKLKQSLASGISNTQIQEAYSAGLKAGAWGGKLLGAGGGGFLMFFAPQSKHQKLDDIMANLRPFNCNLESKGSQIIFNDQY